MFTGIITATGTLCALTPKAGGVTIEITSSSFDFDNVQIGDSIAVNGCCLTVTAHNTSCHPPLLSFDLSPETLAKTSGFVKNGNVNLEKAMRLSDRLDGHLVSGHVDGVGKIIKLAPVASNDPAQEHNYLLVIEVPKPLLPLIATKGSLTVHGVSLTTNTIDQNHVSINLIPHTFSHTVFSSMKVGDHVNLEIDLIARYVARLMSFDLK
ncbi:MAG: riboflavin synthase [Burkholderiales bacterium]|jgi:riboflavin synthase|nr:riboflavin synthase [Burkholderiales bacterium]